MSNKNPDPRKRALFKIFMDPEEAGRLGKELGRLWLYVNMSDEFLQAMERLAELQGEIAQQEQAFAQLQADKNAAEAEKERYQELVEQLQKQLEEAKDIEAVAQEEERGALDEKQAEACRGLHKRASNLIKRILTVIGHIGAIGGTVMFGEWLYQQYKPWIDELSSELVEVFRSAPGGSAQPASPLSPPKSPIEAAPESPLQPESPIDKPEVEASRSRRSRYRPSLSFDWVTILAGEFLMGSDKRRDSMARDSEMPQHRLYLPRYQISRVPVTNAQYQRFVADTGHRRPSHWTNGKVPQGKADHPVVNVAWHDAQAFCIWAKVRLPTEAEWEKAARGTGGRIWPWGNEPPTDRLCNSRNNVRDTTPVGSYPAGASPYGCLDMAGNVWEWTSSLWGAKSEKPNYGYPYDANDGRENLAAPDSMQRVLRGGSFVNVERYLRCAARYWSYPYGFLANFGFRLCAAPITPGR